MARTKTTQKPEDKIIAALVFNKEIEQYRLPKETKISYRTILRTLKPLEDFGFIRLVRTEPSQKGGKEKKIYAATIKGIWAYLGTENGNLEKPEGKKKLEHIINLFPDLLLFFKKWPLFVKAGIHEEMLNYFVTALRSSWHYYYEELRYTRLQKYLIKPSKHFQRLWIAE